MKRQNVPKDDTKKPKSVNQQALFMQLPTLEFSFNREVVIEGSKGIVHYSDNAISINTDKGVLSFEGRGLNLKCISHRALIITGFITKVEFLS